MKHYLLAPRETVFQQGDPGNNFFIVSEGKVEIVVNRKSKGYISKGYSFG